MQWRTTVTVFFSERWGNVVLPAMKLGLPMSWTP